MEKLKQSILVKFEFDNIHLNSLHRMEKPVPIKCHTGGTWKVEVSKYPRLQKGQNNLAHKDQSTWVKAYSSKTQQVSTKWASARGFCSLHPPSEGNNMGSSRLFPPAPLGTHQRRQCSSQSHLSHHFPSRLRPGFCPELLWSVPQKFNTLLQTLQSERGQEAGRRWGTESKDRSLCIGLLGISSKEGRAVPQWKSRPQQTACHSLHSTATPRANECAPFPLPSFSQVIKIQIALLQIVGCFLLPWSKADFN